MNKMKQVCPKSNKSDFLKNTFIQKFYNSMITFNVTFKVISLENNTPGPTIFPFVIAVLEIIFSKAVQSSCHSILDV